MFSFFWQSVLAEIKRLSQHFDHFECCAISAYVDLMPKPQRSKQRLKSNEKIGGSKKRPPQAFSGFISRLDLAFGSQQNHWNVNSEKFYCSCDFFSVMSVMKIHRFKLWTGAYKCDNGREKQSLGWQKFTYIDFNGDRPTLNGIQHKNAISKSWWPFSLSVRLSQNIATKWNLNCPHSDDLVDLLSVFVVLQALVDF